MRTLDRYIFRQTIVPVAGALAALTAITLISQSLTTFDLVVERGQSAWTFVKITLLSMPQLAGLVFPIAIFVGTLIAITRLQGEHEFTACFASGVSLWRVAAPIVRIGVYFSLVSLIFNLFLQPLTAREMRRELFAVKNDVLSTLVREGAFSTSPSGLTIYVQRIDQNNLLRQIFIRTPTTVPGQDRTYVAREGKIRKIDGASVLVMRNGSSQQVSDSGILDHLTFDEYSFDITAYFSSDDYLNFKEGDRYMRELFFPNKSLPGPGGEYERNATNRLLAEGHARLASPIYNISFVMLAIVAVLGGGYNRNGYAGRIAVVAAIAVASRLIGVVAQSMAGDAAILNVLQYLVPLAPLFVCINMLRKSDRQGPGTSGAGRSMLTDFGGPRGLEPIGPGRAA